MNQNRVVVLNENSGSVRSVTKTKAKLSKLGHVYAVGDVADFNKCYEKVYRDKPDVVVFAGGDGTFIHGVEALRRLGYKGDFAVLPLGTSNYVARNLEIPMRLEGAIKKIQTGSPKNIPVAQVNGHFFILYIAVGLSHKVAKHASAELKRRFGQAAYVMELVRQSRDSRPFSYYIESPQLPAPLKGSSHQLLVYNSNLNQQVYIAPKHSLQDPMLRLIVADTGRSVFKLYAGWLLMMVTFGRIRVNLNTAELQEADITITPRQSVDYDGEVLTSSKYHIQIGKEHIRIIC